MSGDTPFASGQISELIEEDGKGEEVDNILQGTFEWDPQGKSSLETSTEMYTFLRNLHVLGQK